MSITITMPIPARALSPNASSPGNWRAKSEARRQQRNDANLYASTKFRGPGPKWARVKLVIRWFAKQPNYIPDFDNAIASCKGIVDGMTDAGVILNDRGIEGIDLWRNTDKLNPRVEITVTEVLSPLSPRV